MNMGLIVYPLNVGNYQYTPRNIPEERGSHLHRSGSLKSRKSIVCEAPPFAVLTSLLFLPLFGPDVFVMTLFADTLRLCSSLGRI